MNTVRMNVLFKNGAQRTFSVEPEVWEEIYNTDMPAGTGLSIDKRIIIRVDDISAMWVDEIANNV